MRKSLSPKSDRFKNPSITAKTDSARRMIKDIQRQIPDFLTIKSRNLFDLVYSNKYFSSSFMFSGRILSSKTIDGEISMPC
jgi:hypothetical protein